MMTRGLQSYKYNAGRSFLAVIDQNEKPVQDQWHSIGVEFPGHLHSTVPVPNPFASPIPSQMATAAMSDPYGSPIWLHKHERFPNTCIDCGMFTDHLVTAKAIQQHQTKVAANESQTDLAVGCLLHLLGPVGWILAALLQGGSSPGQTVEKTVTTRGSIKVPCCRLCAAQKLPKPLQAKISAGQFAFQAHPRFAERLYVLRQEADKES